MSVRSRRTLRTRVVKIAAKLCLNYEKLRAEARRGSLWYNSTMEYANYVKKIDIPEDSHAPTELQYEDLVAKPLTRNGLAADDSRRRWPQFSPENFQKNLDLVAKVKELADAKGVTAGQLALAWVLAQGDDIVLIPGTKHVNYLQENIAATEIVLSAEDIELLESVAPKDAFAGARYLDMSTVNR
jgi:diketogulonate reductase-like aldo/keto reductase